MTKNEVVAPDVIKATIMILEYSAEATAKLNF